MTKDAMEIGERIAEAREAKGLTVSQMARRLGVKTATLRNWESGHSVPRSNRLLMLSGVLDVTVLWLLEGDARFEPRHLKATKIDLISQKLERAAALQSELAELLAEIADEVGEIQSMEAELDELAA